MAVDGVKFSERPSLTAVDLASDDKLHITDVSAGTGGTKTLEVQDLALFISDSFATGVGDSSDGELLVNNAGTVDGRSAPSGTIVGTTDTQTLSNKTLTAPVIASPTGLVKGDVGLANVDNTSDATKNAASVTLTNKTLTTPTIGSFTNAGHNHTNSAGGGQLTIGAFSSTTGSGAVVGATSPTLVTPTIGVATATSVNKVAITAPASSATLTIANGKTLTASNTLTFTGTDASSVNFGAGGTVAYKVTGQIRLEEMGPVDLTGATNSNAAMLAAVTAAKNAVRALPYSLQSDTAGSIEILLPAGDILITANTGMLGLESLAFPAFGLTFRGCGKGITNIIFKPTSAGSLMYVTTWGNIHFIDIGFYAATSGCTILDIDSFDPAYTSRYHFHSCAFVKFKYVCTPKCDNNADTFLFHYCDSRFLQNDGAWFYVPSASNPGGDQILFVIFDACAHYETDAPMIRANKGGFFSIRDCDVSAWGANMSANGWLIELDGTTHNDGVTTLSVRNLRMEIMSVYAGLMYSEWGLECNVVVDHVDVSSQFSNRTFSSQFIAVWVSGHGVSYKFRDCTLAGGVWISSADDDCNKQHNIEFESCAWAQAQRPSDVVTYSTARITNGTIAHPPVRFIRCRPWGPTYDDANTSTGAAVWDSIIGWNSPLLLVSPDKSIQIGGGYGAPFVTQVQTFCLPVGALINRIETYSPAGTSAEGDGGTWTVTDGNALTLATLTVSGALSAGFRVGGDLTLPILCSTTAKSKIIVTPTNVANVNPYQVIRISGCW